MDKTKKPFVSTAVLAGIVLVCVLADIIAPGDAARMDFDALLKAPSIAHLFGTDPLGRDLFKMILHGGRVSLVIGLFSSVITAFIALFYGALAGLAPKWLDNLLMRFTDLIMSVPSILFTVSILAVLGKPNVLSLSVVIGVTSWMNIAKIVRAQVRQIHKSEYILSAKLMGAKFLYMLRQHLLPNIMPSIMFMLIFNVSQAIAAEATLSFLGLGMPPGTATWGFLMSLSQDALLTNSWWLVVIPSLFLITTLVCMTNIGEYFRRK
ncbi:MAG: ABC transporter permease [Clostridiales bacterium]|nr:ABC transporter permease [Clostridiales bacterium]